MTRAPYDPWSEADLARLRHMLMLKMPVPDIARMLGCKAARINDKIKNLRTTGVRPLPSHTVSFGARRHVGEDIGPPIEPARAIKDDLAACEKKWTALFGGERTLAYARAALRMKLAAPPKDFDPNEKIEDLGAHFALCNELRIAKP